MKAVAITDLHLGTSAFNSRINWMLSQFTEQILNDIHPDVLICLGDVFHTKKPASDTVEFAVQFFKKLADNIDQILIIPGNHDKDDYNHITATDFLDDIASNIEVLHEPVETMDYLFLPYQRILTPEMHKKIQAYPQVFLHQGYSEAFKYGATKYGKTPDAVTAEELEGKQLALIGHIHTPYIKKEQNLYILGSPYQLRYSDPMLERCFACWDMEDPTTLKLIPYKHNFYLQAINHAVPVTAHTVDDVIKLLPSPAKNFYYQVNISLEGSQKPNLEADVRRVITETYQNVLDSVSIMFVVPQKDRKFYSELRIAASLKKSKAPAEMLSIYMDRTKGSFYKANPNVRAAVLEEFKDIAQKVAEDGN